MALKESGKVIGNICCGNRDFAAREVGYIVNKHYQQQGYAAEALSAVIAQAFREGAHRIYAECDPRNVPSWKLLEKVGLRREAHFRQISGSAGPIMAIPFERIRLYTQFWRTIWFGKGS